MPSSPVAPEDDPTLLFTNAGMNQFKSVFLSQEKRSYKRATSSQKCIRAGGKHNDLENVGKTARHHTFFEMLGNFSFGDYFKAEAIEFAWEYLTKTLGLLPKDLWITIFEKDDEAFQLWRKVANVPAERIIRMGKEDNFWSMGSVGPCGPCSEIVFDQGPEIGCGRPGCGVGCDCDRFLELWNLVFMQFDRDQSGRMTPLLKPSIDTGLGLERMAAVMQGVDSNFDTDLLRPIISRIEELTRREYTDGKQMSFRVIADHVRALAFALADGVLLSNEGRGYVLRRILRRAARHGRLLDVHEPFLYKLTGTVVDLMKDAYPELNTRREHVALVIKSEEGRFGQTLEVGLERFNQKAEQLIASGDRVFPGKEAFVLLDTYGFPLDLTQDMAAERGLTVDVEGFEQEMERQRQRSRERGKFYAELEEVPEVKGEKAELEETEFIGYETLEAEVRIVHAGERAVVLDRSPFYAEAGGQVGDTGRLVAEGFEFLVKDTVRQGNYFVHQGEAVKGRLEEVFSKPTVAQVDARRRKSVERNHTATHLLQAVLRRVLGEHISQSGSLVAPDRLRFDFTHYAAIDQRELDKIEAMVNEKVRENLPVTTQSTSLDEAKSMGAIALFGEKYGQDVRVVQIGDFSLEICGGTHLEATGEIGQFRLLSESGIAAGVRRIEALTGEAAYEYGRREQRELEEVAAMLRAVPLEVADRVEKLLRQIRELEKTVQAFHSQEAEAMLDDLVRGVVEVDGIKVASGKIDAPDVGYLRRMADRLREKLKSGVGILGAVMGNKATFVAIVTDDLIKGRNLRAGDVVKGVAQIVGGTGGGKPHLAQAGGKDVTRLDDALRGASAVVQRILEGEKP